MPAKAFQTSRPVRAMLLGLAAALLVAAGHWAGLDQRAELAAYDLRCLLHPPDRQDQIVHVDIDDRSLEELGRWPWPREQLAGIVETLLECGARTVAVDIILPDPQETRYVCPATELYAPQLAPLIGPAAPVPVFDDAAFASLLSKHDNIFLPMHMDFTLGAEGRVSATTERLRIEGHADRTAERILTTRPGASFVDFRNALGGADASVTLLEDDAVRRAYLRNRALREMRRLALPAEPFASLSLPQGSVIPPLVTFAQALRHSGFVTAVPDMDGVVRRTPLLATGRGGVYPQFAFAIAVDELGRRHGGRCNVLPAKGGLLLDCPDGWRMTIPTDPNGAMWIRWPGLLAVGESCPRRHISASGVGEIRQLGQRRSRNMQLARRVQLSLAQRLGQAELLSVFEQADAIFQNRLAAEAAHQQAALFDPPNAGGQGTVELAAAEAEIESRIDMLADGMLENLDFYLKDLPSDDPRREEIQHMDALLKDIAAANEQIDQRNESERARLRGIVGDRICLLGSTASGAADFQVTPMDTIPGRDGAGRRTAGVVVHGNILGTILHGRFLRQAPVTVGLLAVLLAGAAVSLVTATRPVLQAAPLSILIALAYVAANAAAFAVGGVSVALVAPLTAMAGAFVTVTAYRQLTEERAKRHIRGLFAQALSSELVDRLIEDPTLAQLGGRRATLSCLVTDLAGFTALSEAIGEQRSVAVLNRYFDRMTEVIQARHGGYLNKFLGDGVLAFFGAPVPQADHAHRAIQAAVDCQEELASLNEELSRESPGLVLACRIGVTTGAVMVGNCGSTRRMDYTAIGDPVNLASRLESACKQLGTRILACQETVSAAGDSDLLARPLGWIGIAGRAEPVRLWEIVGRRRGEAEEGASEQALADFAQALKHFHNRRFAQAAELFSSLAKTGDGDKPSQMYLELCRSLLACPPGDDWDAALRLREK